MTPTRVLRSSAALCLLTVAAACSHQKSATAPPLVTSYRLAIHAGQSQSALPGHALSGELAVLVSDPILGRAAKGVTVRWRVTLGTGASVSPSSSVTDSTGLATATVTLGSTAGPYEVTADIPGSDASSVVFNATAVGGSPVIESAQPASLNAGDTLTLRGHNFGGDAARVLFSGFAGDVVSASDTLVRVIVPPCLPTRQVQVVAAWGEVSSAAVPVQVTARPGGDLSLPVGGVTTLTTPSAMACLRLSPQSSGTRFLLVVQNANTTVGASMPFQLTALAGPTGGTVASAGAGRFRAGVSTGQALDLGAAALSAQDAWETHIRRLEQRLPSSSFIRQPRGGVKLEATTETVPSVGDKRDFQVINKDGGFTKVTAVVEYVGKHGIIYQDVNAPADGFTSSDFKDFSDMFDDPIYDTDVNTFGAPSDIDGNGHIIILLTPVVNELTPKGSAGFVAGFFYGNDLTTNTGSNHGEIFYSMVPDPNGKFGDPRPTATVLEVVPPTLAHEFMHMIHFNQRVLILGGSNIDALWLSEGLAHMAEDVVGQVFADRGDQTTANLFQRANYTRAYYYLASIKDSPDHTYDVSLLDNAGLGSLEQRGAAWLLLKYLVGHEGIGLLKRLVQTTLSSTDNVSTHAGMPWATIYNDESTALYADGDPELKGAAVDSMYTYSNIDLRKEIYSTAYGGFALQPEQHGFVDFAVTDALPASAPYFIIVDAGTSTQSLSLDLEPLSSAGFATSTVPQLAILRLK